MTGFGRARGTSEAWRVQIECKSVNRERLDVRVHLPGELKSLESVVRGRVQSTIGRGKVDVHVDFEMRADRASTEAGLFDAGKFNAVVRELQELSEKSATGPVNLSEIVEFREFFQREQPFDVDEDDPIFLETLDEALEELFRSRLEEGEGLEEDLGAYLGELGETLETYRERAPEEMASLRSRTEERVREALQEFDGLEPDEERLAREIVYQAEKADVSEELQRAASHVGTLRELIDESDAGEPVGKEIDFYLQELVRETNTLSSKSASAELTDLAVSMKSTVDKMREQAANVE